jgi:Rab proteins geranylgeranyltransferase component A
VFHARGAAVSLLVSSNVSRYLEFNTVEESLIFAGSSFQLVPSSKEGLLTNTTISLRDKRVLSKLLQNVVNFIDGTCDGTNLAFRADGTFDELLTAQGLSLELKDYVIHAMAMVNRTAPWREGVLSTQKYLRSLNVYGSTAFLVSSYGVGELPQAFCRMCAVYAGVYMLATTHTLLRDEAGRLLGVNTPYGTHLAPLLVTPAPPHPTRIAHRTVAILTGPSPRLASRVGSSNGTAVVAVITPRMLPAELAEAGVAVSVVQVGPGAHVCPEGYAVVNLTFASTRATTARDAALAEHVLRMLARMPGDSNADTEALPTILFAAHFAMPSAADPDSSGAEPSTETDTSTVGEVRPAAATAAPATSGDAPPLAPAAETRHVLLRDAPDASLFADEAIENARILFHKLVGAVEFMPAAPNPEDIVWTESAPDATTEESAASKPASGDAVDTAETLVASLVSNAVASGAAAAAHEVEEEHCAARSQEDESAALAQTEVGKEESLA